MATYDTRNPRGDSGQQPDPHYCTSRVRGDGTEAGCPLWPDCLFSQMPQAVDIARHDWSQPLWAEDDGPSTLGQDLATLAGWAFGAVLFIAVATLLLDLFV